MWKCPNCQEVLEDQFDQCWNCGSDATGIVVAQLATQGTNSDSFELPSNPRSTRIRFSVLTLIGVMTLVTLAFQVVSFGRGQFLIGLLLFAIPTLAFFYFLAFKDGPFDPLFRDWNAKGSGSLREPTLDRQTIDQDLPKV